MSLSLCRRFICCVLGFIVCLHVVQAAGAETPVPANTTNGLLPAGSESDGSSVIYRLSPFDKISVSVYGEPDLSSEQLISDSGTAFIPLIGPVKVGGKTVNEASKLIEKAFKEQEYLRRPLVTISIEKFSPKN